MTLALIIEKLRYFQHILKGIQVTIFMMNFATPCKLMGSNGHYSRFF